MSEMKQGTERINEPKEEIYLRTEKGAMKGEIIAETDADRTVRTLWTHDGKSVGAIVKIPTQAVVGQPLRIRVVGTDGQEREHETGNMQLAVRGEKGKLVTMDELIATAENPTLSTSLPQNPGHPEEEYKKALAPYGHDGEQYAKSNPESAKCDYPSGDEATGWKIHLDVEPQDAQRVSEYLKQNNYTHKYLSGGDESEGKAFTVFFGSRKMIMKWANRLSQDLGTSLRQPKASGEIELAPGIAGRFVAGYPDAKNEFGHNGEYGLVFRKQYVRDKGNWKNIKTREDKVAVYTDAYRTLAQKYGKYFHG